MNAYATSARDYLARARHELASDDASRLFYAAFELRAGIESRLQEYLESHEHVPKGRKRDWQIARLGRSIAEAFTSDSIARVEIRDRRGNRVRHTLYYTPVPNELQQLGKRLGDYLHSIPYRPPEDPWWSSFRTSVEVGCHLLQDAVEGTLLGPPLVNKRTGQMHLPMELPFGTTAADFAVIGDDVVLDVRYFHTLADARGDTS